LPPQGRSLFTEIGRIQAGETGKWHGRLSNATFCPPNILRKDPPKLLARRETIKPFDSLIDQIDSAEDRLLGRRPRGTAMV